MGFFSDFFKVQTRKLRTDGIYLWKFSGPTVRGFCPGISILLLFVGNEVYMEDFDELYNPSKQDLREIMTKEYFENLQDGSIKRDKDQIEVQFGHSIYRGQILENKLILDYFSESYDIYVGRVMEKKLYSNAEFNFYSI